MAARTCDGVLVNGMHILESMVSVKYVLGRNHIGCGSGDDTSRHDKQLLGVANGGSAGPRKTEKVGGLKGRNLRANNKSNLVFPWCSNLIIRVRDLGQFLAFLDAILTSIKPPMKQGI